MKNKMRLVFLFSGLMIFTNLITIPAYNGGYRGLTKSGIENISKGWFSRVRNSVGKTATAAEYLSFIDQKASQVDTEDLALGITIGQNAKSEWKRKITLDMEEAKLIDYIANLCMEMDWDLKVADNIVFISKRTADSFMRGFTFINVVDKNDGNKITDFDVSLAKRCNWVVSQAAGGGVNVWQSQSSKRSDTIFLVSVIIRAEYFPLVNHDLVVNNLLSQKPLTINVSAPGYKDKKAEVLLFSSITHTFNDEVKVKLEPK